MAFVPSPSALPAASVRALGRRSATTMKADLPSVAAGLIPAVLASPAFAAGAYTCPASVLGHIHALRRPDLDLGRVVEGGSRAA